MLRPDRRPTSASQAAGRDVCPNGCGQPYRGGPEGPGHLGTLTGFGEARRGMDPTDAELRCVDHLKRRAR